MANINPVKLDIIPNSIPIRISFLFIQNSMILAYLNNHVQLNQIE